MAITMTERAADHVKSYIAKRGKGIGLRLAVRTTGCSGMAYVAKEGLNEGFQFNNPNVKDECGCGESFNI